jgi:hypothetical protein
VRGEEIMCHWPFRTFVNPQLKNIRARIVAHDIEIVLASDDLRPIDFGG